MARRMQFQGCFTALVTPFSEDSSAIDFGRLKQLIARQKAGGVTGVVFAGTTGESPTLSQREWQELIERGTLMAHEAGILSVAGTGSNSTHHAVELQKLAAKLGADATLSVNPYYNKPGQEGLYQHYMHQADSASIPTILYNIPGRTGSAMSTDTIERLSKHPNIAALKDATGSCDSVSDVTMRCPDLAVLSGDDSLTLPFASVGAVGCVSVISNVVPGKTSKLCQTFLKGEFGKALAMHRELLPLCRAMFVETNPIPVKGMLKLMGLDSGVLRLPMTSASGKTMEVLKGMLASVEEEVVAKR
jgi:4-hydroxy-tetrahydrodipicolinate synthase